ncbi:kinase-like domain-containing protein [Glomus cerebriforme]|uniref:Kinase-like domain-containing protein n=1 Tax=Glomus cerebriforme TaxID=658196 RepID=A0A397SSZ3_9GLOM|nr:kinase-like domain-containing protein [Glomus cerebriforme]
MQINKYKRNSNINVALKCLKNSPNITEFLNEIQEYSTKKYNSNIIKIYGISQDPDTKNYILVLEYAEGGNFNEWIKKSYETYSWFDRILTLFSIIGGLIEIHRKNIIHRDLHTGNILIKHDGFMRNDAYISDMGLCKKVEKIEKVENLSKSRIYGVLPYVAPEVLRGKLYTQASDIYSFGMIMYFIATGKQPFANCEHDMALTIKICNGERPEINESEAPECYIDLMKRCWDPDPDNRPNANELYESVNLFFIICIGINHIGDELRTSRARRVGRVQRVQKMKDYEIKDQFREAEEYRKNHLTSFKKNVQSTTHPQAIYTSRLLNPFTKDLSDIDDSSIKIDYKGWLNIL